MFVRGLQIVSMLVRWPVSTKGQGKILRGTDWYWIDFSTCIDCGICLQVCPVEGAIVAEERPELQKTPA
jgi:NAD-dependent dihydropyrimidine dehydrogenase PreA subunit